MTTVETIPYAHGIFQQPWWLDAVAPGSWDAVTVKHDGQVVGRLPFVRKRRLGLTILTQPPLTPFLGPWLKPFAGKAAAQLSQQEEVFDELIAGLPHHDVFQQNFHYSIGDWLPFFWSGFQQTTRYTLVQKNLGSIKDLWEQLDTDQRRRIRKSEKEKLIVRTDDDIDKLLYFLKSVFERQSLPMPYKPEIVRRIFEACKARRAGIMHIAEDKHGRTHAVSYMVWDSQSAHGLLCGDNLALRSSGAGSRLVWEEMKYAADVTSGFNFEGSMSQRIERFLRGFGGERTAYCHVFRGSTLAGRMAHSAHSFFHRVATRRSSGPATSSHVIGTRAPAAQLTLLDTTALDLTAHRVVGSG